MDRLLPIITPEIGHILGEGRDDNSKSGTEGGVFSRENGIHHGTLLREGVGGGAHEERGAVHSLDDFDGVSGQRKRHLGSIARHLDGRAVTRLRVRNGRAVDALLGRNHCGYLEFRGMEKSDRLVVNRSRRIIRLLFRKWVGLDLLGCGSGTESSTLRCAYRFAAVLPFLAA